MFELELNRNYDRDIVGSSSFMTDIGLKSTSQLNLNLTEPLIEVCLYTYFSSFQWPKIYLASMVFDDIHIYLENNCLLHIYVYAIFNINKHVWGMSGE